MVLNHTSSYTVFCAVLPGTTETSLTSLLPYLLPILHVLVAILGCPFIPFLDSVPCQTPCLQCVSFTEIARI